MYGDITIYLIPASPQTGDTVYVYPLGGSETSYDVYHAQGSAIVAYGGSASFTAGATGTVEEIYVEDRQNCLWAITSYAVQ